MNRPKNHQSENNHSASDIPNNPRQSTSSPSAGTSSQAESGDSATQDRKNVFQAPQINLPKGGGAIQGIGEKFQANPVTGTGSMTVPIAMSPGRGGFTPQLALSYDSGAGNSPFGLGWNVGLPSISRKTSKGLPEYGGLPTYYDAFEKDVFLLSGAEDLVPMLDDNGEPYKREEADFMVYRYIPRIEGLFARIEKWVDRANKSSFWKSITKENITTIYGQSEHAKIVDPKASWKTFEWKIEKSFDDKGNVICYEYKKENGVGLLPKPIFEKNRNVDNAYSQTYLKRVLYGNEEPYLIRHADFNEAAWQGSNRWLFELIFDYGEHFQVGDNAPAYEEKHNWQIRSDIFSSYRSGFDIRTYRLCRRILMFHHFESELGIPSYLVKVTHFEHEEDAILTKVKSIKHTGYRFDTDLQAYTSKSFPPVSFTYTEQKIDLKIYEIHSGDLPNAPQGIDGQQYQFNDFYGEGMSGVLSQKGSAWYYKRNEGCGSFGAQQLVAEIPSLAANSNVQIADFGGDGLTDVVIQNGTLNGYYELSEEAEWSNFKPFQHPLSFNLNDPNLRQIDLDGNGIPDILITENDCFVWYAADAKDGYKVSRRVAKALDEEQGARVVFNESFQTIFLSDMTGDGLTDIVRVRNGEICYWANMGHGRFSPKITMANAPHFDFPDYFDPSRIRLADIDGSGSIDILYLGRDEIQYWLNQSGNSWSATKVIQHFPKTSNLHTVSVFDLLGNGTSCIVWSSPLPAQAHAPMKYIKLMGDTNVEGNKPYLLKEVNNNMGAITRMKYEASTKFYLEDRKQGRPWITKLPFPVQVLTRQEVYDQIAGNHFVTRNAYHHGYFDKIEREFRGFGMVEQWDTEDYETLQQNTLFEGFGLIQTSQGPVRDHHFASNWSEEVDIMPPVYTKTWFHNGYYRQGGKITKQYEAEYYAKDMDAWQLPDTDLPIGLTPFEKREAARAIKGRPLRVEVYGLDGTAAEIHPYTVTETKYHVKTIQDKVNNRHASFYVCACETLSYQYERNPADPRIAHQHTLEIDEFGNVLKSAAIVYPRRTGSIYPAQNRSYGTYSEAEFINKPNETNWYRIGVPFAQRSYEITGLSLNKPYEKEALKLAIIGALEIPFEQQATSGLQKRLLTTAKSSFYQEDFSGEMPFGDLAFHALPFHAYEAVYTQGLIDKFEKDGNALLTSTEIENEAGFIKMDNLWWRTSGRAIFDENHFYLPIQQLDPLEHVYEMGYDPYHLAMTSTATQIYGKTVSSSAQLDYRTIQPIILTDPNGNISEAIFDEFGMVIATAVKGKNEEGDSLDNYLPVEIPGADMRTDMYANPHTYLQGATSFFYYDLNAWQRDGQPNYALSIVREVHGDPTTKTQINFSYSDGFGQTIMAKVQAEPGTAFRLENGLVVNDHAEPRWVGNGRTVFNNKGNPVKQYEPYFSHSFDYEMEMELVEYGVTPVLHYDPLGRNVRTDLPDGTFTEVEFTPWEQRTFDQNDTVLESDWYAEKSTSTNDYERRAATLAAAHADTPKVEYLDTLGRVFLMVDDDGTADKVKTQFTLDILGNQMAVTDALDRLITVNHFNMAKEPIHTESMDAGRRWSLTNSMGNPLYQWNDRNFRSRMEYDELQRNTGVFLSENETAEEQVYKTLYGEQHNAPESLNLFGQIWKVYDQSGLMTNEAIDFKGNPLRSSKQVAMDYKNRLDWSAGTPPALESESFTTATEYDALNRAVKATAPDQSETEYIYNEANFIEKIYTRLRGVVTPTPFVEDIDYDTKGQRIRIRYGNGVTTRYDYDLSTFRLTRLFSTRNNGSEVLQDLKYYYDPVGNITDMQDDAQQTIFFANTMVEPHSSYTYDPLYRLLLAEGREQIGQSNNPADPKHNYIVDSGVNPNDGQAMRRYTQEYEYDKLGNILRVSHHAGNGNTANAWVKDYIYELYPLQLGKYTNRLTQTTLLGGTYSYTHDVHGNMATMPHLPQMLWDFADQLKEVDLGGGGREYYTYTIAGGKDFGVRNRKVTEKAGGKICDRIYIADFEIYREGTIPDGVELERETLHIQDDKGRIALVDTLTMENGSSTADESIRYQLSNHLGSSVLELDDNADLISYEEFYPFGGSSYRARWSAVEVALKRYRYVGKERDESTGLDYYGARYYGSWLYRFSSVDNLKDEYPFYTPYQYAGNKPIAFWDLDGNETSDNSVSNIGIVGQQLPDNEDGMPGMLLPTVNVIGEKPNNSLEDDFYYQFDYQTEVVEDAGDYFSLIPISMDSPTESLGEYIRLKEEFTQSWGGGTYEQALGEYYKTTPGYAEDKRRQGLHLMNFGFYMANMWGFGYSPGKVSTPRVSKVFSSNASLNTKLKIRTTELNKTSEGSTKLNSNKKLSLFKQGLKNEKIENNYLDSKGEIGTNNVRLVPKNGLGNKVGNRWNADRVGGVTLGEDGIFTLKAYEFKLSTLSPKSSGQLNSVRHAFSGNKMFEVRTNKLLQQYGIPKGTNVRVEFILRMRNGYLGN